MAAPLLTVAAPAADEFTEKKSRFIGSIAPVADEAAAQAFLAQLRSTHKDARHHCYAWVCGENDLCQRSSDAGEPAGTAGRPILEAIKRADLHGVAIVVTRYFGGVLLGAGGLTRAYAHAAQLAIDAAEIVQRIPARRLALSCDYHLLGKAESLLARYNVTVESKLFAEQVCFICLVDEDALAATQSALAEAGGGALRWQDLGEQTLIDRPR